MHLISNIPQLLPHFNVALYIIRVKSIDILYKKPPFLIFLTMFNMLLHVQAHTLAVKQTHRHTDTETKSPCSHAPI